MTKEPDQEGSKFLADAIKNVDQMRYDIHNYAMGADDSQKKKFNVIYYLFFASLFAIGFFYNIRVLMMIGGIIVIFSFLGWMWANIKNLFKK
tara:strand:+ start:1009 stop:1284 length:276 start_codon:yes stop_codon:yes gene_type:complete